MIRTRLLVVLAPATIAAIAVLVLQLVRRPAEGTLVIQSGVAMDIGLQHAATIRSLDMLRSIIFRNVPITVEADRITISTLGSRTYSSLRIEPLEGNVEEEVSNDVSAELAKRLTLKLQPSGKTIIRLSHQSQSEANGFYLDLQLPSAGSVAAKVLYQQGEGGITLAAHSCRITVLAGPQRGEQITVTEDHPVTLGIWATTNPASITAIAQTRRGGFATLTYGSRPGKEPVQLFSGLDAAHIEIASSSQIETRETSSLFVEGAKVNDYRDVSILLHGEKMQLNQGVQANTQGLQVSIHGKFDDVAIQTAGGRERLLPTILSRIQGVWAIVLGAAFFIVDKLTTIYRFVQPTNQG